MPRPDFPKSIFEFQQRFATEEDCMKFLIQSRWPDGFVCPKCGHNEFYWLKSRNLLKCTACSHQTSPTAGTVMHRSRTPLPMWFYAAYLVSTLTPGISATQLQRQLGLSSYQTVFNILHKLRSGMVNEDRTRLQGIVQVDETYVGGEKPGLRGRGAGGKVIVACAAEIKGKGISRVRLRIIPNVNSQTLTKFVKDNVIEGSTIITDDWNGYNGLEGSGYKRIVDSSELVNIHRVFANLKQWLVGTHKGVSPQHLQAYLNEFMFRMNRRVTPMAAFQTSLGLGSRKKSPTYRELYDIVKGTSAYRHPNPASKKGTKKRKGKLSSKGLL